jgi:hypothetical protein
MRARAQIEGNAKAEGAGQRENYISFVDCGLENGKELQLWDSNIHKNTVWSVLFVAARRAILQLSILETAACGIF